MSTANDRHPTAEELELELQQIKIRVYEKEKEIDRMEKIWEEKSLRVFQAIEKQKQIRKLLRYINAESMNMKKQHNAMVDGYDEIDQIFEAIDEKLKVLETKVNDEDDEEIKDLKDKLKQLKTEWETEQKVKAEVLQSDVGPQFADEETAREAIREKQKEVSMLSLKLAKMKRSHQPSIEKPNTPAERYQRAGSFFGRFLADIDPTNHVSSSEIELESKKK